MNVFCSFRHKDPVVSQGRLSFLAKHTTPIIIIIIIIAVYQPIGIQMLQMFSGL